MSTTFTDTKGRQWDCTLTLGACRRVDASDFSAITDQKFSILRPDKEFFGALLTDTSLLFAVIWAVVRPQANKMDSFAQVANENVNEDAQTLEAALEEEFTSAINGEVAEAGRSALWGALSDFFPKHRTVLSAIRQQFEMAYSHMETQVMGMIPEVEALIKDEITTKLDRLKTDLQTHE